MYKIPKKYQDLSGQQLKLALIKERKKEIITLVCSQTNYTPEKAKEYLEENGYRYIDIIKKYLNPNDNKKQEKKKSINQKVLGEIRNFLDTGCKIMAARKKKEAILKVLQEKALQEKALQEKMETIKEDE